MTSTTSTKFPWRRDEKRVLATTNSASATTSRSTFTLATTNSACVYRLWRKRWRNISECLAKPQRNIFLSDYRCRSTQFRNALRNYHFTCRRARTSTGKRSRYKKEESQRSFDQLRCIGHWYITSVRQNYHFGETINFSTSDLNRWLFFIVEKCLKFENVWNVKIRTC